MGAVAVFYAPTRCADRRDKHSRIKHRGVRRISRQDPVGPNGQCPDPG